MMKHTTKLALVLLAGLMATQSATQTLWAQDGEAPRAGASALSHTGQAGRQTGAAPAMSDADFFKICKKQGGGASTTETGNRTCRDADGNPVLVPFPIPID